MTPLILYFSLSMIISFICSLLESVILSVTPAYINVRVKSGSRSGFLLQKQKKQIDRPLAAILTLNTVAHTVGAAGVGAEVAKIYGDQSVALASAILTVLILIFTEILPKTLGTARWKALAPGAAFAIEVMIFATYPFVLLSKRISKIFERQKKIAQITREEMIENAEIGASEGSIRRKESQIIKNLLMLDNIKVGDVMTPRSVINCLPVEDTVKIAMLKLKSIKFSRIPVFEKDLDHVVGFVHRYRLMEAANHDLDEIKLGSMKSELHTIPENMSVAAALDQFIKRREHIFLAVDDYGITAGIISLEDAIETLLGVEIVDEFDNIEDMRAYALEKWRNRKTELAKP
jgi:CBS domain containing-hemolysin-like protein